MSRRIRTNVGIIGLGIIGSRVAESLRRRGFYAFVWNRTPRLFPNFVGSPAEVAELCNFIQIFVSDDAALMESVEALKPSLQARHIVMAHSTVAPETMRAAADIVQRRGAQFLDAPFTGSKLAAEKGELVYYLGGDDAVIQRARPVLEGSSKEVIELGEIGHATTVKLATNIITATTVEATAEALALVHHAGIPVERFATAMRGNAALSPTLAMKLPTMLEGNFEPHFSVKHMLKDIEIVARLSRAAGLRLGAAEAARVSLLAETSHGRGDDDYSSVMRVFFPERAPHQQAQDLIENEEQPALELSDNTAAVHTQADDQTENAPEVVLTAAEQPIDMVEPTAVQLPEEQAAAEAAVVTAHDEVRANEDAAAEGAQGSAVPIPGATEDSAAARPPDAPEPALPDVADVNDAAAPRRGFFSRLFSKAGDY